VVLLPSRIEGLGGAECLVRVFVLEQVESGDPALIGGVCAGLREGTSAERQQHARRHGKV